ncbi:alkyl sulfatase dimerization domain-containing protein [Amycolatopsis sp. WGS_07]|uniref:alkyl sulfatase dimerization domain-containing protein n=1 Tax=Amycolatopsis sp. WGS_07 TaxID=3076764 RepID=UPI0038736A52
MPRTRRPDRRRRRTGAPRPARDRRSARTDRGPHTGGTGSRVAATRRRGPPGRASTIGFPWLQPVYDEAEFIVRNVIRHYGGWWSGRPSELKPAPRQDVAAQIADLAGGTHALLQRAGSLADTDLRLACHLADYALEATPGDPRVAAEVARLYTLRADSEPGLMATNLYRSAASYAQASRPFA